MRDVTHEQMWHSIYTTLRVNLGGVRQLMKSKLPHDGDKAATILTDAVMHQLRNHEFRAPEVPLNMGM